MVREREDANAMTKLTYFLIGAGIGAIVALLFAPKSGRELREDIVDATRKGLDRGKEAVAQLQEKAEEYYEITRERAEELAEKAKEKAGDIAEKAKEVAAKTANPISAAIEAGKQAYIEEKRKTEASMITEGRPTYPEERKTKS